MTLEKSVGYMEYSIMRELNVNEIQQVNGGLPIVVAIPSAYIAREYGAKAIAFGAAAIIAWFAE
tara:strand:- start:4710 stop:4901 length:192 start_codon:yes stop_codon:yes gene_type:complete